MKLAIMQPYFFPYIGYFQLIAAVDKFVFYDDVGFIKNGWINRNRILLNGSAHYITVPIKGGSHSSNINQVKIDTGQHNSKRKLLAKIESAYKRAPYFSEVYELFSRTIDQDIDDIAALAKTSITSTLNYLGISRDIVGSSEYYKNQHLHGQNRVIDICSVEGAKTYVNAMGGRCLYSQEAFNKNGIELCFLQPHLADYKQNGVCDFVAGLSILDVLMNNPRDVVHEMLLRGIVTH